MKILVIEDEEALRETIVQSLQKEQYIVETANDVASAQQKTEVYEYDCILLDIGLPGGSGLTILEELIQQGKTEAVIIISARNSIEDKVRGLELGADDYLAKPFHLAELHARIKSVIRRKKLDGSKFVVYNNVKVDAEQRLTWINEKEIQLKRKEFDVLLYLMVNKNRLVNKTALAEHVWGDYIDEMNSYEFIYSQIKNLRKRLKDEGAELEIQAIYGVGYKLSGECNSSISHPGISHCFF
jgi:two-component system, OmpR family, response regulator ArlR